MYRKKHNIYRVWNHLQFQASTGGSWNICPMKKEGLCIWQVAIQSHPNHRKADCTQLIKIYNSDAVTSKQTPAGWGWGTEANWNVYPSCSRTDANHKVSAMGHILWVSCVLGDRIELFSFSVLDMALHHFCYTENHCVKACWHPALRSLDTCSTLENIEYESRFSLVSCGRPMRVYI